MKKSLWKIYKLKRFGFFCLFFLMGRFWCREARVDDPLVVVVLQWGAWMCHHSSSHLIYQLHSQPMLSPMMTSPPLLRILSQLLHHCKNTLIRDQTISIQGFVTRAGHKCLVKTNTTQFVSTIYIYIFGNDYRRDSPARAMPTIISTYIHKTQCGRKRF